MSRLSLLGLTLFSIGAAALAVATPAESARSRDSFNQDWRFARFGAMPDGSRRSEPGSPHWAIQLSASSEETDRGNFAALAMDGDPATRWCASSASPDQWLMLDLEVGRDLGSISIQWEAGAAYRFAVEGSQDGQQWQMLADKTQNTEADQTAKVALSGKARFVRVRTTGLPPEKWASISEIGLTDAQGKAIENQSQTLAGSLEGRAFDDRSWRKLDVPHDWGIEGPFRLELAGETGKLPWRGIGWYRKHFTLPAADAGRRVFVDFDGTMAYAKVWLNGEYLGTWPYGYSSFRMELTSHLRFGAENVLAVRLDTEKWDSRWYPGAGIYRNVWLVKTELVHVAHWGTYLTTPQITDSSATVQIVINVDNQGTAAAKASLRTDIYELGVNEMAGSKIASTAESVVHIAPGTSAATTHRTTVPNPKRWGLSTPYRYLARTVVSMDGKVVDQYDTPFGIRTLEFTARNGFRLNGKRVEVQGTCNHHDLGALGAAMNTRALERQLEILKNMGCNSLRTSHNPPAPELLDLADKMGFLVWDEAFDSWAHGKKANDYNKLFKEWHVKDLQALVHRDRNHPSVFIWSIGNEVMEQRDVALTKHLADVVRAEDPTRPVSNGYNDPDGGRESGAAAALDIMGVNYFFGQQPRWDADPRYKDKPTVGSETSSCVSSRGEYFFGGNRAHWQISSYDHDRPDWGCDPDTQFRTQARFPHLLGEYVWTGFDYLGEPTPYGSGDDTQLLNFRNDPSKRAELEKQLAELARKAPPSRSSYFGIIDLAGFPKDRYYLYQAHWRPELPMAHILPHWNWPERAGQVTPVHVYTSGDEAELFLNGKSLGRKAKRPGRDFRLVWDDVKYEPGELKVIAYLAGKEWATDIVKTTGEAAKVMLTADRSTIKADGQDLAFITARIADKDGLTVPRTHNLVRFQIDGPGEIVAVDNGDATSFEPFQASQHKAFNGLCLVIVRAKPGASGTFIVKATSNGLADTQTTIVSQ